MTQTGGPQPPKWPEAPPSFGTSTLRSSAGAFATAEMPQPPASGRSPTLKQALTQRVRFAGGSSHCWGVLAPVFAGCAVLIALGAAAAHDQRGGRRGPDHEPERSFERGALTDRYRGAQERPKRRKRRAPRPEATVKKPLTVIERAAAGDSSAIGELEQRQPADLAIEEHVAIAERGRATREREEAIDAARASGSDPALIKSPKVLGDLYRFTQNPESAREALAAIANVPGPSAPICSTRSGPERRRRPTPRSSLRRSCSARACRGRQRRRSPSRSELRTTEDCDAIAAALPRSSRAGGQTVLSSARSPPKSCCGPNKRRDATSASTGDQNNPKEAPASRCGDLSSRRSRLSAELEKVGWTSSGLSLE